MLKDIAVDVATITPPDSPEFSICTLVTEHQQYADMVNSYLDAGFVTEHCEFLYQDNTKSNQLDAYEGLNLFLRTARGRYVILCHQDLLLHDDGISRLREIIEEMNDLDEHWAVLGNAGGAEPGKLAIRITDPFHGENARVGRFPVRTRSLDENFLLVKASSNLSLSRDIGGFHLYGTDLCLIADILGYRSYAVDFHLRHIGGEAMKDLKKNASSAVTGFDATKRRFINKYRRAFRSRWIQTTCATLYISCSRIRTSIGNRRFVGSIVKRLYRLLDDPR